MGKVGGQRNFGYGKQMAWAGKNALAERYGAGHFGTRAAHEERWARFAAYAAATGVKDCRAVTREMVASYGQSLAAEVRRGAMTVAYAQNLLSTVNVVLETLRGDRAVRVSPAEVVGQRVNVRSDAPAGLRQKTVERACRGLGTRGEPRVAAVAALARELGLRFREASLLDARAALAQAQALGRVNITQGTKGGRGREVDRWVPVSNSALRALEQAARTQATGRNLVPQQMSFRQWRNHAYGVWQTVAQAHGLAGFHSLRAAYACERYRRLTGSPAPAVAGQRRASRALDRAARERIAYELGHGRADVAAAYVGSAR
jgi:hypothetical protein